MKSKLRLKLTLIICSLLFIATLLVIIRYILFVSIPIDITTIPECRDLPLTETGNQLDMQQAIRNIRSQKLDAKENGFRLLLSRLPYQEVIEHSYLVREKIPLGEDIFTAVNFPRTQHDTLHWDSINNYLAQLESELRNVCTNWLIGSFKAPVSGSSCPDYFITTAREWLERNRPVFDLVKKAVESDVFEVPIIVYDDNYPVVHSLNFIFARDVCFGFRLRDLIDGADTAIDSRILIIRLCEAVHKSPKGDNNVYEAHALLNLTFQLDSTLMAEIPADDWLTLQDALKEFEDKILCDNPNRTFLQKLHKIHWLTKISTNQTDDYYNGYVLGGLDQFLRELGFDWNIVCQEMLRPEDKRTTWPAWNRTRPELYPPTSWLRENLSLISRTTRSHFLGKLIHARINELSTPITEQKICKIRMLRLTAALWGYQATHGHLPPLFTTNEKGERLHSWRVLILPWLGEQELYEKIRLDEPWDSEYNLQFHDQVQKVWFCPSTNLNDSGSVGLYQPIVGPNALFDLSGQGKSTQDFFASHPQCDLKRVALLVETSQKTPRCWMEPDDGVDMDLLVAAGNSPYCGSLKLFCEHENYNIITSDMTIMPGTIQNESLFRYACITGISTRQITKKENNHDTTIE